MSIRTPEASCKNVDLVGSVVNHLAPRGDQIFLAKTNGGVLESGELVNDTTPLIPTVIPENQFINSSSQGPLGSIGPQGETGPVGENAVATGGPQGSEGAQGPLGAQGPGGAQGPEGGPNSSYQFVTQSWSEHTWAGWSGWDSITNIHFPSPLPDTNYQVFVSATTIDRIVIFGQSSKSTTGFTITQQNSTPPYDLNGGHSYDFMVVRNENIIADGHVAAR